MTQSSSWLPNNGLYIADVSLVEEEGIGTKRMSLAVNDAQKLPAGGATFIVKGDLILQDHFNYNSDPENPGDPYPGSWDKQPAAAIVSDDVFLVSHGFTYPRNLTYSQHHRNYPYEEWFDLGDNMAGLSAGPGFYNDYATNGVIGYNWLYDYRPDNPDSANRF